MIALRDDIRNLEAQLSAMGVNVDSFGHGSGVLPDAPFRKVWPDDPAPIGRAVKGEPIPMPMQCLPKVIADYAFEVARVFSVPVEYAVVPALIYAASLIGPKVRVKGGDRWHVPSTLWGYVIGVPGMKKNAAAREAHRPIAWLESTWKEQHELKMAEFKIEEQMWIAKKGHLEKDMKKEHNVQVVRDLAEQITEGTPEKPIMRRLSVGDVTVEKLVMLMQENRYLLLNLDELRQLFAQMTKKGFETLRTMMLTSSDGTGTVHVDRVGRESDHVEDPLISIFGTMQDDVAEQCLLDGAADGFSERFSIGVWPPISETYDEPTEPISDATEQEYFHRMVALEGLDPSQIGGTLHEKGFYSLGLDDDAKALFKCWRWFIETGIRLPAMRGHSRLSSVLGKSSGLPLKFALIDHLLAGRIGDITLEELSKGIALTLVFFSHAEKVFEGSKDTIIDPSHVLLADLLRKERTESFQLRDIYIRERAGLGKAEVEAACTELTKQGWIINEPLNTKGRPSIRYWVNPKLHSTPFVGFVGSLSGNTLAQLLGQALTRTSVGKLVHLCYYLFNMDIYYIYIKHLYIELDEGKNSDTHFTETSPTKPTKGTDCKQLSGGDYPEEWDDV